MRQICLALAAAFAIGCGGIPGDHAEPGPAPAVPRYADALQGNWILLLGDACAIDVAFSGVGFVMSSFCETPSGQVNAQVLQGTFTATADRFDVVTSQSTCADDLKSFYYPYKVSASSLVLTEGATLYAFTRNAQSGDGTSGVINLGCYDAAGTFVSSPLAPI